MTLHELAKVLLSMDDCEIDAYEEHENGQLFDLDRDILTNSELNVGVSRVTITTI